MSKKKITINKDKAGLYIRVSSRKQVEEGYSLEAQERTLKAYCEVMNWEVVDIYKDEGISGKTSKRPELQRLLQDAREEKITKVVSLKLDRISRNVKDMLNITDELDKMNVGLVCVKDNIDTSTAAGKLMRTVLGAIAQFESDIAKERTLTAKEELATQGKFAGGNIPYGYIYNKEDKEFIINEDEAQIVERIYNDYINGKSAYQVAKELNESNIATKKGGKWQPKQVIGILNNKFYTGQLEWEGIINKANHDALISVRTFNKAQKLLEENSRA